MQIIKENDAQLSFNSQEIVNDYGMSLVLLFLPLVCISLMSTLPLNKLELKLGIISSKKDYRSALVYWVLLVRGVLMTDALSADVAKGCCAWIRGCCYHVYGSKSLCS
ncbi:hypothetical protein CMV_010087 [Castanea mollissima]|uniref:Uncharacterized protein n=1 Tax=Castanea mollissima TaxID=60419 RepID=A0A8J4VQA8_9ROSI|nr:hypothetical protein CMV_010087 [Castanea mollissima]